MGRKKKLNNQEPNTSKPAEKRYHNYPELALSILTAGHEMDIVKF